MKAETKLNNKSEIWNIFIFIFYFIFKTFLFVFKILTKFGQIVWVLVCLAEMCFRLFIKGN